MRFYLDSAIPEKIELASQLPFCAGITSNPDILRNAGDNGSENLLAAVAGIGRRDWKVWVHLRNTTYQQIVDEAESVDNHLAKLTGGTLAGPTLVYKLLPTQECLWAASTLVAQGKHVCITAMSNPVQALALTTLPGLAAWAKGRPETEGPPASRNPGQPQYVTFDPGRIDAPGRDPWAVLTTMSKGLAAAGQRTRILATGIRSPEMLEQLVDNCANLGLANVDVTLPFDLLGIIQP